MSIDFQGLGEMSANAGSGDLAAPGGDFLSSLAASASGNPLAWTKLGLGTLSAFGSGIQSYLDSEERKRARKLQEQLAMNADRRAERAQEQEIKAYGEGATQRAANTLATLAPVVSQAQTLRDRLRLLGGMG